MTFYWGRKQLKSAQTDLGAPYKSRNLQVHGGTEGEDIRVVGETLKDGLRREGLSPLCAAPEGPRGAPSTSGGETEKEMWRERGGERRLG